ncbi:MAG: PTS galactitol transporter subunit IIC [Thermoflexus hugenholtzii]|jgi:PTS system galactitol-specific IIC component|uniref:PTS galactitol transporter subunit IIC n=1 Tax=Thermoflexus TaxID=1495649 RepID=UPI001C76F731|nr:MULTISPECIES: PTS transporter subunit IIC [Thermoflexus]MDT7947727.1 PTS transporter subunit IIC [Thermoflexus sp.]QWK11202.1 MAG: PTS galactitol transporter subunit IIC [Thermoflexus hugenholtzii]
MEVFLSTLKAIIDNLGATVALPIIIFLFAVALGAQPGRAFRAGVTIGIAFIGINLVIGLMWTNLSEVAQAMVKNTGIQRDVVDVGWPSAAAIAFGSAVGLWVIPLTLAINILMLAARLTKTLDIDIWNYWHFAFIGSLVVAATGNLLLGLLAAAIAAALALFFADWTAPAVQRFYGLPGISIPHLTTAPGVPIAIVVNWIIDRIPGLREVQADPEAIRRRLGIAGEPVILGLIIGLVLGILGFYNAGDVQTVVVKVLKTAMNLAAVMLLLPRMVQILMEGLIPVSEAARDFMQRRAGGREIYIGLDSAILIGHPAAISTALVLVPVAILLSAILPGNRVILFADLAVIPFVVAMFAPLMRGNIFRMIIAGTITLAIGFYIATGMADLFTAAAVASGFKMPEGAVRITSIADGFLWPPFVFVTAVRLAGVVGLLILLVLLAVALFLYQRNARAWEIAAGAPAEG